MIELPGYIVYNIKLILKSFVVVEKGELNLLYAYILKYKKIPLTAIPAIYFIKYPNYFEAVKAFSYNELNHTEDKDYHILRIFAGEMPTILDDDVITLYVHLSKYSNEEIMHFLIQLSKEIENELKNTKIEEITLGDVYEGTLGNCKI